MINYIFLTRFEEALKAKWYSNKDAKQKKKSKGNSQGIGMKRDEANSTQSFYTNEETEAQGSELIYPHG